MADGTDDLEELEAELDATEDFQDEEASAALSEAQSVIDDAQSTAGSDIDLGSGTDTETDQASTTDTNTDAADDSGSLLPSFSLPSLPSPSLPSPSLPSPSELFSVRFFVVAVVAAIASGVGAGLIPLVEGLVAGGLGMFGASFLLGLVTSKRHYFETALAGASVLGALSFFGRLELVYATGGSALRLAGFGVGVGVLTAVIGTYLGRDVRKGIFGSPGDDPDPGPGTGTDDFDF